MQLLVGFEVLVGWAGFWDVTALVSFFRVEAGNQEEAGGK
jgi:hypothetical protein